MANLFYYDDRPDLNFRISNSTTNLLMQVLALAASALATSDKEREFAVCLAAHDQSIFGIGMVSFDVGALPWSADNFAAERAFVLKTIAAAEAKTGWERLGYVPQEPGWLWQALDGLRTLVEAFAVEHASPDKDSFMRAVWPDQWVLCPAHQVYEHKGGCIICLDR